MKKDKKASVVRTLIPTDGTLGLSSLPQQLTRARLFQQQQPVTFSILCIGQSGLGKSTLLKSLLHCEFEPAPTAEGTAVTVSEVELLLTEDNVRLQVHMFESQAFGDQLNQEGSFQPLLDHIDGQFEKYFSWENTFHRQTGFSDPRIHLCLFLLSPNGPGLSQLDLACLRALNGRVNLVPILAKADTLSKPELAALKARISSELSANHIQAFSPDHEPCCWAVVSSNDFVEQDEGGEVRARDYPWGTVPVESEAYSDLASLRKFLFHDQLEELLSQTDTSLYQVYRKKRLAQMGLSDDGSYWAQLQALLDEQRSVCSREEETLRTNFMEKVKQQEMELKHQEKQMHKKYDGIKARLSEERHQLEDMRLLLEQEKTKFMLLKAQYETQQAMNASHAQSKKKTHS